MTLSSAEKFRKFMQAKNGLLAKIFSRSGGDYHSYKKEVLEAFEDWIDSSEEPSYQEAVLAAIEEELTPPKPEFEALVESETQELIEDVKEAWYAQGVPLLMTLRVAAVAWRRIVTAAAKAAEAAGDELLDKLSDSTPDSER